MSYFNTNFGPGAIGGGVNELALEQFSERAKDAEKQRTDNAMKMAKEQARLESMAVGFGLKSGEAKSMSSIDLDKFVYAQMQSKVKEKEHQAQQMQLQKFLQDQQYQNAQIANFKASQEMAQENQRIANRNSMINQGNMLANRAKMNSEQQSGEAFRNSITQLGANDPDFANKNKLLVEGAKSGVGQDILTKMLNGGMDSYQASRLKIAQDTADRSKGADERARTTFDQSQRAKEVDYSFTSLNSDGAKIPMFNIKGKFNSEAQASKFKEAVWESQNSVNSFQRLINLADEISRENSNTGKRLWSKLTDKNYRTKAKIAEDIAKSLMGSSRTEILGGGVLSDQDRKILEDMFVNPTDIIQLADYGKTLRAMLERTKGRMAEKMSLHNNITVTYPKAQASNSPAPGGIGPGSAPGQPGGVPPGYKPQTMSTGQKIYYSTQGGGLNVAGPDSNSTQ